MMLDEYFNQPQPIDVKTWKALLRLAACGDRAIPRAAVETYEEFVSMLQLDVEDILDSLENSAPHYFDDGEDKITSAIVGRLVDIGYVATQETDTNGHVDLTVTSRYLKFTWLGEAKLDNGAAYLWGGWLQLTTRYSKATESDCCGGILVYMKKGQGGARMMDWADRLVEEGVNVYSRSKRDRRGNLGFYTTIQHPKSGRDYEVRHMAVLLQHDPKK